MKKILLILLICFFATPSFAGDEVKYNSGYVGTLPDVTSMFQPSVPVEAKPVYDAVSGFNSSFEIKPTPRDNAAFVNIILKKDKTSQYINDINQIIPIVNSLYSSIEKGDDVQKFVAKATYFTQNVDYLREKYRNKSESNYISFKKLMALSEHVSTIATLRAEALTYNPYLAYSESGYIYNPNNINQQIQYLQDEIENVIVVLKDTN